MCVLVCVRACVRACVRVYTCVCVCVCVSLSYVLRLLFCGGQALEEYGTQESSEQNVSELEAKMEAARQNLRRAEVLTP